jgi:predicted nucleotidyltransferase
MSKSLSTIEVNGQKVLLAQVLHDLTVGLRQFYSQAAPRVFLYGSQARTDAHENSDIDILLLFPDVIQPGAEIRRLSGLLADLNLRYGVLVSIFPATEEQYIHAQGPFWRNIRREGIEINGSERALSKS